MSSPHPLVGRRVTHVDGGCARVLAAALVRSGGDEYPWWSLLVEWVDGSIDEGPANHFTFDNPSIKDSPKRTPAPKPPGKADAP